MNFHETDRLLLNLLLCSIHTDSDPLFGPKGVADIKTEPKRFFCCELISHGLSFGKISPLDNLYSFVFPGEFRCDELHCKQLIFIMIINVPAVLGMIFHSRTNTTGKLLRVLVYLETSHIKGEVIHHMPRMGVLGGADVIEQCSFIEIHDLRIGTPLE